MKAYDPSILNDEQRLAVEHPEGHPAVILAGAGSGKCLGRGTPVLMFDGTIKVVEDIVEGDTLMGPDSSRRRVLSLARGRETMYRVTPVKGSPFECNESHMLSLKNSTADRYYYGQIQDVSVKDYLGWSKTQKKCFKLYRVGVNFRRSYSGMDPYLLGLWLGDGTSDLNGITITTIDPELKSYVSNFCGENGFKYVERIPKGRCSNVSIRQLITGRDKTGEYRKHPLVATMRRLGLHKNKHIPHSLRTAPRSVRLKLLAGLVDSDGYVHKGGCEIATKFKALADDIVFLVRSLGLACYSKLKIKTCYNNGVSGLYYILSLSGDMSEVPTLLPRKKFEPRKQIKDVLNTGFSLTNLGEGDYFGFTLDGDGRFLLGDFTVTHNTHCLTNRVLYISDVLKVPPKKIAAITFTNKGANELKERIHADTNPHNCPRVTTIHSLALSAIRKDPVGFGLDKKVSPIDDYNQNQIAKKIAEDMKLVDFNSYGFLDKISYHRVRGVGFRCDYNADVHAAAQLAYSGVRALTNEDLAVWKEFEKQKTRMSVVDFDDMIHLFVRRGIADEKWRNAIQGMFAHVLMDEAQDTNTIQHAMVDLLLAPDNRNFMMVGDLSQSIYGFSGAAPEILHNFTRNWRNYVPILYKLERNHRSVPEVVKLANKTQRCMVDLPSIQMDSYRGLQGEKGSIMLRRGLSPKEIAATISNEIWAKNQLVDGRIAYKDTAILIRAGSQVRDIEPELVRNRIPYIVRGAMGLMKTEEIRDILSYMRIAANPKDYFAMLRSISVPKRGVGDATLEKIRALADKSYDGDLIQAAKEYGHAKFAMYTHLIEKLVELKDDPIKVLNHVIMATKYKNYIQEKYAKDRDKVEAKLGNLKKLEEIILGLMAASHITTEDLVFQLAMQDQQEDAGIDGKVVISTIHSAKGLEWKSVYVVGCVEGQLPHKWSSSPEEVMEERRIFYVACTRARDNLVLCVPSTLEFYNKASQYAAPSRFLVELGVCK